MSGLRFDGWIPYRIYWQGGEPGVEWMYLGAKRFVEPFFEETIYAEAQTPFNSLFRFRTPLGMLAEWDAASPGIAPAGFIFHLSRCGSTLITRMLGALEENLVLSEPPVVDRMLRAQGPAEWLKWLVGALAQPRCGRERRLFVKFEPRNIVELPYVLGAFPDVPWIFVYRDPVEVLVSNLRSLPAFLTQGILSPDQVGIAAEEIAAMERDDYAARVLGMVAEKAARHAADARALLVEYGQLPGAVGGAIARHFGLELTAEEAARMEAAARLDAKHPGRVFTPDGEAKRREATPRLRELAARWIAPAYARLEEMRLASPGTRE